MKTEFISVILKFSKSQRKGLLVLFALITLMQATIFWMVHRPGPKPEKQSWAYLSPPTDTLIRTRPKGPRPFNPNFLSDYKAYMLGMSVAEIDRLFAFRKTGRYVNSAQEFQQVTRVSDAQLQKMEPFFRFPEWVQRQQARRQAPRFLERQVPVQDINSATAEDLKKIYGIGDGYARRILNWRAQLGGFVHIDQVAHVWGLPPEVVVALRQQFAVVQPPEIQKVNINQAGVKELSRVPYFNYSLAKSIVTYRSMNGPLHNADDLAKISDFPVDKIKIIALYLEF